MKSFSSDQNHVLGQKTLTALEWSKAFESISNKFMPPWLLMASTSKDDQTFTAIPGDRFEDLMFKPLGILSPTRGGGGLRQFLIFNPL